MTQVESAQVAERKLIAERKSLAKRMAAEKKPAFTGRWVLAGPIDSTSDTAHELTVRRRQSLDAPFELLTVERRFRSGVRSDMYQVGLEAGTVGGIAGPIDSSGGAVTSTWFSSRWDGDTLVIKTGTYSGPSRDSGPFTEHAEVWSLDRQGRLHITTTDRSSGTESKTTNLVYRRR
jgi:hypothetical protein